MSNIIPTRRILVADDEPDVLQLVSTNLKNAGYKVLKATDGRSALDLAQAGLAGAGRPRHQAAGYERAGRLQILEKRGGDQPDSHRLLSAKAEEADRIAGLELGADDYMAKPFSPRELVLRVNSVLRRVTFDPEMAEQLEVGEIHIDRTRHEAMIAGKIMEFTASEFRLLALLIERRERVQDRNTLLNDVWGDGTSFDTPTVDTHICRLREKLGKFGSCIQTIRGFGYRLTEAAAQA